MKSTDNCTRLFLWSGPRNISTTLMYSFAQRRDTVVYDEPLYGSYLAKTGAKEYHPDAKLIMNQMECNEDKVIAMMTKPQPGKVLFFKNMTHHFLGADRTFMQAGLNIILTRDPVEMLPSFDKVIPNPTIEDVGYAEHIRLLDYFEKNGLDHVVLDAKKVLLNPEKVLKALCIVAGIEFSQDMLEWPAGPRPEDGIWARHWYRNVHQSTGYNTYSKKTEAFPNHLEPLLKECQAHYKILLDKALE